MKKRKNLLLITIALMISVLIQGQDGEPPLTNVFPPSPTAASLAKYAEIPVSLYTGIPNINIPLWEVKSRELSLPVSLSYHASGIKVDELPGWVGLGWALNAGGVITRTMRGKQDEYPVHGYFDVYHNFRFDTMDLDHEASWDFLYDLTNGYYDTEPDMFSFNFNGRTGQFVLEPVTRSPVIISREKLKIMPEYGPLTIIGWTILDESGVVYRFFDQELTSQLVSTNGSIGSSTNYTSSWYLSQVISPSGMDTINFHYKVVEEGYDIMLSQDRYLLTGGMDAEYECNEHTDYTVSNNISYSLVPEKISYNNFDLVFSSSESRLDTELGNGPRLDTIFIFFNDERIKTIVFDYDYFNKYKPGYKYKRLKLTSVQEFGKEGMMTPPHKFTYEETVSLPPRQSYEQDYWGYNNGRTGNTSLLTIKRLANGILVPDANREPNPDFVHAGILTKIQYPTGGDSEFEYEAHDYGYIENENGKILEEGTETKTFRLVLPEGSEAPVQSSPKALSIGFAQDVYVIVNINDLDTEVNAYLERYVAGMDPEIIKSFYSSSPDQFVHLEPGFYSLRIEPFMVTGEPEYPLPVNLDEASITVEYEEHIPGQYFRYAGGLRIKKITDKTSYMDPGIARIFTYQEENDPGRSSGILTSQVPDFEYQKTIDSSTPMLAKYCVYNIISSSPVTQMIYSQGSHIGYSEVTVIYGDTDANNNGKEVNVFTSSLEYENSFSTFDAFPYPPVVTANWRLGKLKEKRIYTGSDMLPVKRIEYSYGNVIYVVNAPALKTGFSKKCVSGFESKEYNEIEYIRYQMREGWNHLVSEKVTDYYIQNGDIDSTVTRKEYHFDPFHLQLSYEALYKDDQTALYTEYTYPFDYPTLPNTSSAVLNSMHSKHMVNTILKKETGIGQYRDLKEISGSITNYDYFNGGQVYPSVLERYDIIDQAYDSVSIIDQYDSYGNILQYHKANDIPVSFLWGYRSTYPVAKIEGATYSEVESGLSMEDINLLQGNSLTDQQVRTMLGGLRNVLPDATVTIYTYDPAYGQMTSVTDPNGKTTYYEYDGLGRLTYIKDDKENILKKYTYHYTDNPSNNIPVLNLSDSLLNYLSAGGNSSVTVISNIHWTVSSSSGWITVSPEWGSDNETLTVNCTENLSTISRTGSVTVSGSGITRTIIVTQEGAAPALDLSVLSLNFSYSAGSNTITVSSTVDWTVDYISSWYTVSPVSGSSNGTLTINCPENPSSEARSGTFTVSGGGFTHTVTISQTGDPRYINVTPTTLNYSSSGGLQQVTVSSNVNWTAVSNDDWITIPFQSGTFEVICGENTSTSPRTGTITVSGEGKSQTVTVYQEANGPELVVNSPSLNFIASGQFYYVGVTSNIPWTASSSNSWITVEPASAAGNGTLTVTCAENFSTSSRTGTVTVSGSGITQTLNITQEGVPLALNLSPSSLSFSYPGGTNTISVSSNTDWTVSYTSSWYTVSPGSGSGNGTLTINCPVNPLLTPRSGTFTVSGGGFTHTVTISQTGDPRYINVTPSTLNYSSSGGLQQVTVSSNVNWTAVANDDWITIPFQSGTFEVICGENTSTSPRTGTITVSGEGKSQTVTVYQEANGPELVVNSPSLNFIASGQFYYVGVTSNIPWTASSSNSWITVEPASATGNGTLTVTCVENPFTSSRTGTVTVIGGGITQEIDITQDGVPLSLNLNPSSLNFSYPGGTNTISVSSNTDWTVSYTSSWYTVSPVSGSGNGTLTINCPENPSSANRSGTFTVSVGGITRTVTISQDGDTRYITVTPSTLNYSSSGGLQQVTVSSNVNWTAVTDDRWITLGPQSSTFEVICDPNGSTSSRIGTVAISGEGLTRTVTVNQEGSGPPADYLNVTPTSLNFQGTETKTVSVGSSISWTLSVTYTGPGQYIILDPNNIPVGASNSGNMTLYIHSDPNNAVTSPATMTISGGGITHTVSLYPPGY